jgi:hypothetical protein
MQHVHVKRKETEMNRYVMEELYRIPDLQLRMERAARRERNRVIRAALVRLWDYAKAHLKPRLQVRPSRWIERLG